MTSGPFDRVELPHATMTSYGIQFRLPVATVDDITLAVILCQAGKRHVGLFLTRDDRAKDPERPRYLVGRSFTRSKMGSRESYLARLCDLGDNIYKLTFNGKPVEASWKTIYVVPTTSDLDSESATSPKFLINCYPGSRFQLPRWLVDRFIGLQFEVKEVIYTQTLQIISFIHRSQGRIFMCLGACERHGGPDNPPLWANIIITTGVALEDFPHNCSEDHLNSDSWAVRSRTFGDADRMVRLSFIQSTGRTLPETSVTIHLKLSGTIFENSMLRESSISFPSLVSPERDPPCLIPDTLLTESWDLLSPWPQVGAFDSGGGCPCRAHKATSSRLFLKVKSNGNMHHPEPIPNASISDTTSSRPRIPSPELKPGTLEISSSRWAFMTLLLTPFAQILRLFSTRRLNTLPAEGGSGSVQSANTL